MRLNAPFLLFYPFIFLSFKGVLFFYRLVFLLVHTQQFF